MKKLFFSIFISASLLVAFAGSCFDIDINPGSDKETEQSTKEDSKSSDRESINLFNAIVQAGHIVFHSDFSFEISRPADTTINLPSPFKFVLLFTKFHKTLFQRIISPNAP